MKKTGFYAITAAAVLAAAGAAPLSSQAAQVHTWLRRAVWPPFFPSLPRRWEPFQDFRA